MATLPETSPTRKPIAFHCQFHGIAGVILRPEAAVKFLDPDTGSTITLTEEDYVHLVVLGEVATAMEQYLLDLAAGGYAAVACNRAQIEV